MTNFTVDDVIAETRKLAAERPDFVYDPRQNPDGECQYVHWTYDLEYDELEDETHYVNKRNPQPGCIFGHALRNLGVDWERMDEVVSIMTLLDELGLRLDDDDMRINWLQGVQHKQDHNETWGNAVQLTDDEISEAENTP